MAKFYIEKNATVVVHQFGSWIKRELYNQVPKGFKICFTLLGFGESWARCSFLDNMSGPNYVTQL